MDKKYLRPAREQLLWIPVFLSLVSILSTIGALVLHREMPEYTLKYMTSYNYNIWRMYALYLVTAISIGWYIYMRKIPEIIIDQGESQIGYIYSPYYRYDFLNYLWGLNVVYISGKIIATLRTSRPESVK